MNTCTAGVRESVVVRHALVALETTDPGLAVALSTGHVARTVVRPDRVAVTFLATYVIRTLQVCDPSNDTSSQVS